MDPAELIDSRPNDGPLALWRNKIVLGVHHDGAGAMPTEWKIMTDRLVHDILFWFDWNPTLLSQTQRTESWLTGVLRTHKLQDAKFSDLGVLAQVSLRPGAVDRWLRFQICKTSSFEEDHEPTYKVVPPHCVRACAHVRSRSIGPGARSPNGSETRARLHWASAQLDLDHIFRGGRVQIQLHPTDR
jgi:hypothetical protein